MNRHGESKNQPTRDWHKAEIKAALEKQGWNLSRLSLRHGYSRGVLKTALNNPWPKAERIIAQAIGVKPEQIWPTRYRIKGEE
jgi:Ner family transcriptional regulator